MSDFVELSDLDMRHYRRLVLFQQKRRFHEIARDAERATVRLAWGIKTAPKVRTKAQLAWLAEVTSLEADAYSRLSHRQGAIAYCDAHIDNALRKLKLNEGATMTLPIAAGIRNARVRSVADGQYLPTVKALVARARTRCLCSIFIVDVKPWNDHALVVDGLLGDLQEAVWRGVDVRLLIGGSRSNLAIAEASATARRRATALGVPCRWLTGQRTRGSHMKLVIADDDVLTGSHNWSAGAFGGREAQDSVLVRSAALAAFLGAQFEADWVREPTQEPAHV